MIIPFSKGYSDAVKEMVEDREMDKLTFFRLQSSRNSAKFLSSFLLLNKNCLLKKIFQVRN